MAHPIGTRVELRGLHVRAELNGRIGEVADSPQSGRVPVKMLDDEARVLLKPENIIVVSAAQTSHFNRDLCAPNVWEIDIDPAIIDDAAELALSASPHARLDAYDMCTQWLADTQKDTYDRIRTPSGCFFAQRVRKWSSDLGWVSVDDAAAYEHFERLFHRMRLPERFASVVPHTSTLRLFSAFYVVRSRCTEPSWHDDYFRSVGTDALTLITPLHDYEETSSFQLLYRTGVESLEGGEGTTRRYVYRKGRALVFGSRFEHATEPGAGRDGEAHVYLSLTFGTDEQARWADIGRTLETQSRLLVQPDGEMRLSHLGERLPWQLDAHRDLPQETVLERVRIQVDAYTGDVADPASAHASGGSARAKELPVQETRRLERAAAEEDSRRLRDHAVSMREECARQAPM